MFGLDLIFSDETNAVSHPVLEEILDNQQSGWSKRRKGMGNVAFVKILLCDSLSSGQPQNSPSAATTAG